MRENADQSNSEYGHFLRSVDVNVKLYLVFMFTYMDWSQEYTDTFLYPNKYLSV